jgi:hypothetical protein
MQENFPKILDKNCRNCAARGGALTQTICEPRPSNACGNKNHRPALCRRGGYRFI